MPAEHSASPVAGATKGFLHGGLGAHKDIGAPTHVSGNQDGLPDLSVRFGDKLGVWREGPGSPFTVDTELSLLALHLMGFYLGYIVTNIIHEVEPQCPRSHMEHLLKGLLHPVGNELAVAEGEIGCAGHGCKVSPAFLGREGRATELLVGQRYLVFVRSLEQQLDVIVTDLMP
jgi:hypothetical protein